jgi:hypothetical protein
MFVRPAATRLSGGTRRVRSRKRAANRENLSTDNSEPSFATSYINVQDPVRPGIEASEGPGDPHADPEPFTDLRHLCRWLHRLEQ